MWSRVALDSAQAARVATALPHLKGVRLQIRPQRNYRYGTLASHVLGYVGEISEDAYKRLRRQGYRADDTVGQSGIEQQYESALHGRSGAENLFVDARGGRLASRGALIRIPETTCASCWTLTCRPLPSSACRKRWMS